MHFRIGVNLGDIIVRDDGTIYGDGVNVAARLESLAEPGGIMLADVARQMVEGKLDVGLSDAGEHEVKNIAKPVRAYRVMLDGTEAFQSPQERTNSISLRRPKIVASLAAAVVILIGLAVWGVTIRVEVPQMLTADGTPTDDPVLAMPTGPSIAVMPFQDLGGDDSDDFFAAGLAGDISVQLSFQPHLRIIGQSATQKYADQSLDVREAAEELGVQYLLLGTVRRSSGHIRLSAELLSGTDGSQVWAETYDRDLTADNVFEVQDEITWQVIGTISDEYGIISQAMRADASGRGTKNLTSYECVLLGAAYASPVGCR
jgi:TolB-like protein